MRKKKKGGKEKKRRVADLLGSELSTLWGGTFHSVGARVLRRHAEAVGYRPDFSILDREDSSELIKTCISGAEIAVKATRFRKAEPMGAILSMVLNRLNQVAEQLGWD